MKDCDGPILDRTAEDTESIFSQEDPLKDSTAYVNEIACKKSFADCNLEACDVTSGCDRSTCYPPATCYKGFRIRFEILNTIGPIE